MIETVRWWNDNNWDTTTKGFQRYREKPVVAELRSLDSLNVGKAKNYAKKLIRELDCFVTCRGL